MRSCIQKITSGQSLSVAEAEKAVSMIFSSATDAQIGAFLMALKMKGPTYDEIAGFAMGMKKAGKEFTLM